MIIYIIRDKYILKRSAKSSPRYFAPLAYHKFKKGKSAMKCPVCSYTESKVIDSRPAEDNRSIRRRRECLACQNRFTTYETVETPPLLVVKKDSTREYFDRSKLLSGIIKSCQKRPITLTQMEQIVNKIEAELRNSLSNEISSQHIGVLVMDKLKAHADVDYERFASVYRDFKDLDTFMHELEELRKQKTMTPADDEDKI